ncbi:hypothetical protein PoB_001988200 [Plakobranchus ocellatus]|uniref:Uncharacterized protein n=1 Tax=Plakobranchus ocellatus TaxID=259542 RepID=A0AAV3ZDM1_9GAST|nr:hypothetical protein PoB_001988200 [Plakobranchus ocellatus]
MGRYGGDNESVRELRLEDAGGRCSNRVRVMVRDEKVWCRVLCMEKVGGKERKELKANGPNPRFTIFSHMSGRDSRVHGAKSRKVRTTPRHNQDPPPRPSHPPLSRDAATGEHAKTKL